MNYLIFFLIGIPGMLLGQWGSDYDCLDQNASACASGGTVVTQISDTIDCHDTLQWHASNWCWIVYDLNTPYDVGQITKTEDGFIWPTPTAGTWIFEIQRWIDGPDPGGTGIVTCAVIERWTLTVLPCPDDDEVDEEIDRVDPDLFFPNAFSPNYDGINDAFYPYTGADGIKILELAVYDRWGNWLFHQRDFLPNDPAMGWDGSFRGNNLDAGVYVWWSSVLFPDGTEQLFKGDVTLIK